MTSSIQLYIENKCVEADNRQFSLPLFLGQGQHWFIWLNQIVVLDSGVWAEGKK